MHGTWQDKANLIISEMCYQSYSAANILPSGKKRKKHVPYSVPSVARKLVDALGKQDEDTAKNIFILLASGVHTDAIA